MDYLWWAAHTLWQLPVLPADIHCLKEFKKLSVMFKNSWFPTVFDDFLNTDFMPRANSTAPAVNEQKVTKAIEVS